MNKKIPLFILSLALLSGLVFVFLPSSDSLNDFSGNQSFELPDSPELQDVSYDEAPLYFFLFTHTEDHINHELSEERYWRVGPMLEELAASHPSMPLTWTIEFMGADANSIADRNAETGLVDYLVSLSEQGLVDFGYHAHHEPTYWNRPQKELSDSPSFEEVYEALYTWVTCKKDPLYGGCVEDTGGGLLAIQEYFGKVNIVTGLGVEDGITFERSAGSQMLKELLPDRWLGFGFTDHGPALTIDGYAENLEVLMGILTPTHDTSSYVFWMDNTIRLNDGGINTIDGVDVVEKALDQVNRDRPHVLNVSIASKYHYTDSSTSPTKWAYANPESPELSEELLNSGSTIERSYVFTEASMSYLMDSLSKDDSGSQFVSSDEVVDLFTSKDYWQVDEAELYNIALWLLNHWEEQTPSWVYDGEDYYSLSDAFVLLTYGLRGEFFEEGVVSSYNGPWSLQDVKTGEAELSIADLMDYALQWDESEKSIEESMLFDGELFSPSQILYALAYAYVLDQNAVNQEMILIPEMINAPETYGLLEEFGCVDCLDTSWSLKPARFQDLGDAEVVDAASREASEEPAVYVLFTLNTQEFMTPDLSSDTLNGVMNLHEAVGIPLDVYLADFIVQEYEDSYLEIFDRLKTGVLWAVSYHIRPPLPYSGGYTSYDFDDFSQDELYDLFESFEEFTVDRITGELTDEPGGYVYLAELMGYSPLATGVKQNMPEEVQKALVQLYSDKGASFITAHKPGSIDLGDTTYGAFFRPEHLELKLFEITIDEAIDEIESFLAENQGNEKDLFVNIKMHDKDFFADQSAWVAIYSSGHPVPPYHLERYEDNVTILSESEQAAVFEKYEAMLKYVAENEELIPVNLFDVKALLDE